MTARPEDKLTPAMRQWQEMKDQHPDKILLFRMGDFYETFHDDAVRLSRLCDLTLTKRGKNADAPALAGVPHHQLNRYLKMLCDKGESVAVADQLEDPAQAKGVVKRGITMVVTPGTLIDENVLPERDNNFLAAATVKSGKYAVAYVDLSTGEFSVVLPDEALVMDEFDRIAPAETLIPRDIASQNDHVLTQALAYGLGGGVTRRDSYHFDAREGRARLVALLGVSTLEAYDLEDKPAALGAIGAILAYLEENQASKLRHLRPPRIRDESGLLRIDRNTIRNLELVEGATGKKSGSLLSVLDQTQTGPGARLLKQRLLAPSTLEGVIRSRQEAVAELMEDAKLRRELRAQLDRMADFERIMARVAAERATPRDLAALAAGCDRLPAIAEMAGGCRAGLLTEIAEMDRLEDLYGIIADALVEDPPALLKDGGVIRTGFHPELDELRGIQTGGRAWLDEYQAREQARTGIPSLKVGYNRVFGYYIEITHTHKDKSPPEYVRKQTLTNAERYITEELKKYEDKALGAEERMLQLEQDLFQALREHVGEHIRRVQQTADKLAELDFLQSLAEAGAAGRYVMPELHDGLDTEIREGRHPVVETLLPAGQFVDNDVEFLPDSTRIVFITGPNMAGKSTYIRQVALLVIMAQLGAPVPAKSARIGIADRVFSRVGAADDLSRGQSTFMVEMVETADILHHASERSLVILDEVGRGTSTFDGVSLAWAITEYLHQNTGARTLFATHYHELAELGHILPKAKNFNVAVREWNKDIVFLRKIQPGACDRSYGIHVAKMAGIPAGVLQRAGEILHGLEIQAQERDYKMLEDTRAVLRAAARDVQLELFAPPRPLDEIAKELVTELAKVDVNHLSPMDAHALLSRLAEQARG